MDNMDDMDNMDNAAKKPDIDFEKTYTADEYFELDIEGCYELREGKIFCMPSPLIMHQIILGGLSGYIWNYIKNNKGNCKVLAAPTDVLLSNEIVYQPDLFVICDPDKLDEYRCNGAPDWVIEITSPSYSEYDYVDKTYFYYHAGVKEYWIVDPEKEEVTVQTFVQYKYDCFSFDDKITVGLYRDADEPLVICINDVI